MELDALTGGTPANAIPSLVAAAISGCSKPTKTIRFEVRYRW
jgi:hypothetical protein